MGFIVPLFFLFISYQFYFTAYLSTLEFQIEETYSSIWLFLSFSHHNSFESEENTIYLSILISTVVREGEKVHENLSNAYYEPGIVQILHAFFILVLTNPIGFGGIIPVLQRQKLKFEKIKVAELLNGTTRIPTHSFRLNSFLFII